MTPECGLRIPVTDPESVVRDLADGLGRLHRDRTLAERLGRGGIERIRDAYDPERLGQALAGIYREVLGGGS